MTKPKNKIVLHGDTVKGEFSELTFYSNFMTSAEVLDCFPLSGEGIYACPYIVFTLPLTVEYFNYEDQYFSNTYRIVTADAMFSGEWYVDTNELKLEEEGWIEGGIATIEHETF